MATESRPYKSLLAGTISGVISKLVEYPFDTLKVLSQTKPAVISKKYSYSFNTRSFYNLYKGVHIPMLFSSLENATMFYSYSLAQKHLNNKNIYVKNAICGLFSGMCVSLILTPSELIKCKMQYNSFEGKTNTVKSFVKTIYHQYGLRGFYNGHLSTVVKEGFGTAVYFSTYEYLKRILGNDVPIWKMALAGSVSGICYWTSIFPIDTIKSNVQITQKPYQIVIKELIQRGGIKTFYRGYFVTACRSIVSNFFIFYSYEMSIRVL
jgi:hypothetical protein